LVRIKNILRKLTEKQMIRILKYLYLLGNALNLGGLLVHGDSHLRFGLLRVVVMTSGGLGTWNRVGTALGTSDFFSF